VSAPVTTPGVGARARRQCTPRTLRRAAVPAVEAAEAGDASAHLRQPAQCLAAAREALDEDDRAAGVAEAEAALDQQPADPARRRALEARIAVAREQNEDR
jgi:hypothetical protein